MKETILDICTFVQLQEQQDLLDFNTFVSVSIKITLYCLLEQ